MIVLIDEVAQKVGIGAVKYADLSQNRISNYIFSFDKMLALQGNTAPYMLYAYARIQGINRENQVNQQFITTSSPKIILEDETEVILAKALLELPEVLEQVERELQPNRLCEYLYELSRKFNKFYENCPVLKSNEPLRSSRLGLCYLTANTLRLGLSLLGIKTLERM
jgi:arginyl-tRNA synthetase